MSQLTNVISTVFRARDGGLIAQLGSYAQGFGNLGRRIQENTSLSERLTNQWRAFGTTIRYAIAGQTIFGLARMAGQLKDIGVQMGLIAAIGTTATGQSLGQDQLTNLLQQNMKGAQEAITPLNEYNDAVINFLSTVNNVPPDKITPMVTTIATAAKLSQISAEDATKAFTTMNVAFGRPTNLQNVHKMAQEFFILTKEAPGGVAAGQQIIGQLGQLSAVARIAGGTPEDVFSLLLSSLRGGIPPSQAGRGLQYLIQTLALPGQQTTDSRRALAQVGITTNARLTLQQRISRVLGHARALGVSGNLGVLRTMDEDTLAELEAAPGGTTGALSSLGITGRGAAYLGTVFHRIHALRTAVAIESQVDVGQAQKDFKTMTDAGNGIVSDVNDLSKAMERFRKQARLQDATNALNIMAVQVANTFAPVLGFVAQHAALPVAHAAARHPHETRMAAWAALGAGALALTTRAITGRGVFSILRGLGGAGMTAQAAEAAIAHPGVLGGSPLNPMYVVVVGQLFGKGGVWEHGIPGLGKKGKTAADTIEEAGHASRFGRLINVVKGGVRGGADAIGTALLFGARPIARGVRRVGRAGYGALDEMLMGPEMFATRFGLRYGSRLLAPRVLGPAGSIFDYFYNAQNAGSQGENMFAAIAQKYPNAQIESIRKGMLHGQAEVYFTLDISHDGKVTKKKFHIPMSMLYQGGRTPSSGGKNKTNRGQR